MKKLILCLVLLSTVATFGQRQPKIAGNRDVVEIHQDLQPFTQIRLNEDIKIKLVKSASEGYDLQIDDNLVDILGFDVKDGVLTVRSYYKVTRSKKMDITVRYTQLDGIDMTAGEIVSDDVISADRLQLNISGSAKVRLNTRADLTELAMDGSASGEFNFAGDSLSVRLRDKSSARVYALVTDQVVDMDNSTSAKYEGTADQLQISLTGKADLDGRKLEANMVQATARQSSDIRINVLDHISLDSSGSAETHVYGAGKIDLTSFLDTSKLYREQ